MTRRIRPKEGKEMERRIVKPWALILALCLVLVLAGMSGCGIPYDAKLYDGAMQWIDGDFLKENRVKAYYSDENYDGSDEDGERFVYEETAPAARTFVFSDGETFDAVFTKYGSDVDFDGETVLLYIFSDIYPTRNYFLKDVEVKERTAKIYFSVEQRPGTGGAATPSPRCLMVRLKKTDIEAAEFIGR